MNIAKITRTAPTISIKLIEIWKKIMLKIKVTTGCVASTRLTTSDGAKFKACSNSMNGRIVPNRIIPQTPNTIPVVRCGMCTQIGCFKLKIIPAIRVPQPRITIGELCPTIGRGSTTYSAAVTPDKIPQINDAGVIESDEKSPLVRDNTTPAKAITKTMISIGNGFLCWNMIDPNRINNGAKYCKIVDALALPVCTLM